jgi:uncharacterized protein
MISSVWQAPQVAIQEVVPKPAPTLLTGVPAFLGVAVSKTNTAIVQLTLWTQFQQRITPASDSYLADAIYGFFQNGGQVCYVVCLEADLDPLTALEQGLNALAELDAIDLVCAPDLLRSQPDAEQLYQMQRAILNHCDALKDRFAILDCTAEFTLSAVQAQRSRLTSLNGALYFPWIKVEGRSDLNPFVPPCGHVAGIYAKSDREIGTHKTPANYRLEGVLDLSFLVSQAEYSSLNSASQAGINCLCAFPGRGIRVWGARTLSADQASHWQYINVRRLFLSVERWCHVNLLDLGFEPNQPNLWIRIERELSLYLESLFQQGALQGNTSEEAFYVRCDDETNSSEQRTLGQVITEVGLAPVIPNEFIVIRLIHGETGVAIAA